MNSYDPNTAYIYNQYLIQSNGIHPSPIQFHTFAQNFYYYYQNQQMQYYQPIQMQYYQIPQNQENFVIDVKQSEHTLQTSTKVNRNCNLNMECKDISCLLFHHPSLNKK
jgi:hypothetical protein